MFFVLFSTFIVFVFFYVFFFKQKTAYEMRISDWSSDVCSSDLYGTFVFVQTIRHRDYFLPPGEGDLQADAHASPPSGHRAVVSLGLLFLALLAVVLLAKNLADRKSTRLNSSH